MMLIRVKYNDNRYDMVCPELLDDLLRRGSILEFLRRDGWVSCRVAAIRQAEDAAFKGTERRARRTFTLRSTG